MCVRVQGNLRRMVYLFLKEVAESTDSAEVIIVVQSLCKDMNNNVDVYRANAIRTLAKIVDVSAAWRARGCVCASLRRSM
jgi:vesicle coat complex subunit